MIPQELSSLFWDIDTKSFVPQDYPEYTMERILELGDSEAVKWLEEQFSILYDRSTATPKLIEPHLCQPY